MFGRIFGLVYRGHIFRGLICGGLYSEFYGMLKSLLFSL